jgi:hypothetical protein
MLLRTSQHFARLNEGAWLNFPKRERVSGQGQGVSPLGWRHNNIMIQFLTGWLGSALSSSDERVARQCASSRIDSFPSDLDTLLF